MRCPFYTRRTCRLIARETGLPLEQCEIRKDACRVCQRETDTPTTGKVNHVVASIAIYHARRHKLSEDIAKRLLPFCRTIDDEAPAAAQGHGTMPSIGQRAKRLGQAAARWIKAGRPTRSEEEVAAILEQHCRPCQHYVSRGRADNGACSLCGCRVNLGKKLNKLRWATEGCPDDPPKFTATVDDRGQPMTSQEQARMSREQESHARLQRMAKRAERKARRAKTPEVRDAMLAEAEKHRRKMLDRGQEPDVAPHGEDPQQRERNARAERKARRRKRWSPPLHEFPPNEDPLYWTDRNKQPIGHILRDLWRPNAGFLVCGGPSLRELDLGFLRERGIVSLGVNNVSGYAPVRAMTFSDPPEKFHHGVFFDPAIMKLVPIPKLPKRVRAKKPDGTFSFTSLRVMDCPNVWGYRRNSTWDPETFLTNEEASWGNGKHGAEQNGRERILFTFFLGLRLLHYLGCRQVFMLGVDFAMSPSDGSGGSGYAFNEQRSQGAAQGNNSSYRKANAMCAELRPIFEAADYHVYNCNPQSRLTAFDYLPLDEAQAIARGLVPPEPWPEDALWGWYAKEDDPKGEDDRGQD